MPVGEKHPPHILPSKNCESLAVTCVNKYTSTCCCSALKEFTCLLSFSSLLPQACGAPGMLAGMPFLMLALYCNFFPHTCASSRLPLCARAAPALSSFVRMKVSSLSCTTCFDSAGLLSRLCFISMQNNEDWCYS